MADRQRGRKGGKGGKARKASTHKARRAFRRAEKVTQRNKLRRVLRSNGLAAAREYAARHGLWEYAARRGLWGSPVGP